MININILFVLQQNQFIVNMKQQVGSQYNAQYNRNKLIQQNIKLHHHIMVLQQKMSRIITADVTQTMQKLKQQQNKIKSKTKMSQLSIQQSYLKKLKNKIKQLKTLNLSDITRNIVSQQNQLTALKKQYQKLSEERKVMVQKCEDKKQALRYNTPLSDYKSETATELARIKKKNVDMNSKIVQLQRQIRKYHKYQQMHRKFKNQKIIIENPQYQSVKMQHEKITIMKKVKLIQQKWKLHIQALDNQYFESKQILERTKKSLHQLQKQVKNWQNRSSAVRDQSDMINDKQRLAKIHTASPIKKQKPKSPIKNQIKPQDTGLVDFFKNLFTKNNKQKQNGQLKQIQNNSKQQKKEEKPNTKIWSNHAVQKRYCTQSQKIKQTTGQRFQFTRLSQKNQFMSSNHFLEDLDIQNLKAKAQKQKQLKRQKNQLKKSKLLTNSVAVGTSFYYNDDQ